MPVTLLLVEGELDAQILSSFLQPGPTIERGGPKGSLAPKTRDRRTTKRVSACYLRDRDFDYEPPEDSSRPSVDKHVEEGSETVILGWRWCRHEIESYLLDPHVVEATTGWVKEDFIEALIEAGRLIAGYTACRWVIGQIRRRLADVGSISSRPQPKKNEIWLPADLNFDTNVEATVTALDAWHRNRSIPDESTIRAACKTRAGHLAGLAAADDVLLWHSGKDLLAALKEPVRQKLRIDPASLRIRLRDWVRDNPEDAIKLFPEWIMLRSTLTR